MSGCVVFVTFEGYGAEPMGANDPVSVGVASNRLTTPGTNSNQLTVSSVTNIANGQQLTIQCGGNTPANGYDFITHVQSIAGSVITTTDNIPLQVGVNSSKCGVMNTTYDYFHFDKDAFGFAPQNVEIRRGSALTNSASPGGTKVRYFVYAPSSQTAFYGTDVGSGIYDPQGLSNPNFMRPAGLLYPSLRIAPTNNYIPGVLRPFDGDTANPAMFWGNPRIERLDTCGDNQGPNQCGAAGTLGQWIWDSAT